MLGLGVCAQGPAGRRETGWGFWGDFHLRGFLFERSRSYITYDSVESDSVSDRTRPESSQTQTRSGALMVLRRRDEVVFSLSTILK